MADYSNNERLHCHNDAELATALDGDAKAIKSFSCDRIRDAELVARISEFVNLESCYVSLSDANLLAVRLGELEHLTFLSLQACRLTDFPISVKGASALKNLSLGNNMIATLPDEIGDMKSISNLAIMQNNLEVLPDGLSELPLLELNLSYNDLKTIPNTIGNLTTLEVLILSSNQLVQLPPSVGQLSNLKTFYVDYNSLESLPDSLLGLKTLKYLNLKSNEFESLPPGLEPFSDALSAFLIDGKCRPLFMDWSYKHSDKPIQTKLEDMNLYMNSEASKFKDFSNKLDDAGVGDLKTQIRNSVSIKSTEKDDYSQLGNSRIGGFLDLEDESMLPRTDEGIWIPLLQLNLADVAELNHFLPKRGLLSFFVRSLEVFECKVIFFEGDPSQLKMIQFNPEDLTDDQDDYTSKPFQVEFRSSTSLPYVYREELDMTKFVTAHDEINNSGEHCLNGYTFTQHESPETQAANQSGGTPDEWISLLRLGYDSNVGFCFWDAGALTFTIHQEDLMRHDFSRVLVSLESS